MRLQTGDIALVRVSKFTKWYRFLFAKLIQFFDRSYYHHAIAFIDGVFLEADSRVVPRPLEYYNGDTLLVLELLDPLMPDEKIRYREKAKKQLSKGYDYWGAMFSQLIYRLFGLWLGGSGKRSERKPYCSELVLILINDVRGYFQDKHKWSPGDIMRKGGMYYRVKWEGVWDASKWRI